MTPYHLQQLQSVCAAHPLRLKLLVAPSLQAGYNLTTALARSGAAWANLRVTTPVHAAAELVGPDLAMAGWRRLAPDLDLFALQRQVREAAAAVELAQVAGAEAGSLAAASWLAGSGSGGLARCLQRTFHALRMAAVAPADLESGGAAASNDEKVRTVASLYAQYVSWLEAERLWDDAELLRRAAEAPLPADGDFPWLILDETPLPELSYRFVRRASGGNLIRIGPASLGVPAPAHAAARRFVGAPYPRAPSAPAMAGPGGVDATPPARRSSPQVQGDLFLDAALERAQQPDEVPGVHPAGHQFTTGLTVADGAHVGLHEAVGVETEVRALLRQMVAAGVPLDQVEIAYTAPVPYLSLLLDAVQVYDLSAAFAAGVPARLTAPGQALAGFLRWLAADLDAGELVEVCRAGFLCFPRAEGGDMAVPAPRVASLLRAGRAGGGRGACEAALQRLLGRGGRAPDGEPADGGAQLERARAQVAALEALVPVGVPAPGADAPRDEVALSELAEAGRVFLETYAPQRVTERDRRAFDSLRDRLEELARTGERGQLAQLAHLLLALVDEHTADASVARGGALYIVPLERAGYSGRPHLWVLGMDESHFPGTAAEDPVLLDGERATLSPSLPLERDRPGERVWHYLRAAGACPGRVELVAGRRGLADGREPYPSPLYEHARKQLGTAPHPHRPAPGPGQDLDAAELALATRNAPGLAEWVRSRHPWLAHGECARRARRQEALTRFDGWAGNSDAGVGAEMVWSAARLEALARCPYRYFLRYALGAAPLEEEAPAPGQWLTALERGQLLHEVFRAFMQGLTTIGQRPDAALHAEGLDTCLKAAVDRLRQRVPVTSEAAYHREMEGLRRSAGVFLRAEAQRLARHPETEPLAFELDFGFGGTGQATAPVVVALSERVRLRLRGRIDRVDGVAEGEYEIWDYKTGSTHGYSDVDLLAGGTVLQWALYAHALPHLLPGRARLSGYFFAGERGRGQRLAAPPPPADDLAAVLEPLLDLAAAGAFPHAQKGGDECRFCDFQRVCGAEGLEPREVAAGIDATRHLGIFAEQLTELADRDAQTRSRQAMSRFLEEAGLTPADLVPGAPIEALEDWMAAALPRPEGSGEPKEGG